MRTWCLLFALLPLVGAAAPYVTVYGGKPMNNSLEQLFWPPDWATYEGGLAGLGVGQEFARVADGRVGVEGEVMALRHWGTQDLWEGVAAVLARWHPLPWDEVVETSLAAGIGISHASELPEIERRRNRDQAQTLAYLTAEATFAPPRSSDWQGVVKFHHRSGAYGTFSGVRGGSNYLLFGLRKHF